MGLVIRIIVLGGLKKVLCTICATRRDLDLLILDLILISVYDGSRYIRNCVTKFFKFI